MSVRSPVRLEFVKDDNPILYERIPLHVGDTEPLRLAARDMFAAMELGNDGEVGIGLAAPQVGLRLRMFVMDVGRKYTCINPTFTPVEDVWSIEEEGCLTRPGIRTLVKRWKTIKARWLDKYGQDCEAVLVGDAARVFQHESEHLDGVCIWTKPLL